MECSRVNFTIYKKYLQSVQEKNLGFEEDIYCLEQNRRLQTATLDDETYSFAVCCYVTVQCKAMQCAISM
jgi:hypothetical protein